MQSTYMAEKSEQIETLQRLRRDFAIIGGIFATLTAGFLMFSGGAPAGFFFVLAAATVLSAGYYFIRARGLNGDDTVEEAQQAASVDEALPDANKALLQALNQPALLIQHNHISVYNDRAARLFNMPAGQSGVPIASLRDPSLLEAIEQVLTEGGHADCEIQPARTPNEHWLADVTALGQAPQENGVLMVMTDQKPVKLAQKARADFLANASHELRTPLTSISGFIETMQGPAKDDLNAWPRFITIMDEQTRHMRDLIGDLLSLSRIELSGHLLPDTRLDLALAVGETIDALDHLGAARGIRVEIKGANAPLLIMADEGEVKQVIRNLVGNAMKYAPDNSQIKLTLGQSPSLLDAQAQAARSWAGAGRMTLLSPQQRSGPAVWLQVKDEGRGIAPEHLPRLGERFFRVDGSRGGPIEGTGLGLAIVKHIMARHRGGLAVESLHGKGASFSVWFPSAKE